MSIILDEEAPPFDPESRRLCGDPACIGVIGTCLLYTSKTQVAQANLNKELGETDLDSRLKTLRNASGDVTAKQQLNEMKAAAAAKRAAAKSM